MHTRECGRNGRLPFPRRKCNAHQNYKALLLSSELEVAIVNSLNFEKGKMKVKALCTLLVRFE